jgi:hypothetical protein
MCTSGLVEALKVYLYGTRIINIHLQMLEVILSLLQVIVEIGGIRDDSIVDCLDDAFVLAMR